MPAKRLLKMPFKFEFGEENSLWRKQLPYKEAGIASAYIQNIRFPVLEDTKKPHHWTIMGADQMVDIESDGQIPGDYSMISFYSKDWIVFVDVLDSYLISETFYYFCRNINPNT